MKEPKNQNPIKMTPKGYSTASEAINDLVKQGYTTNFSLLTEKECLVCHSTSQELSPDDFEIDEIHRFDGMTDPADEMIVYAVSSLKYAMKGLVVSAYGVYADSAKYRIVKKLHEHLN